MLQTITAGSSPTSGEVAGTTGTWTIATIEIVVTSPEVTACPWFALTVRGPAAMTSGVGPSYANGRGELGTAVPPEMFAGPAPLKRTIETVSFALGSTCKLSETR